MDNTNHKNIEIERKFLVKDDSYQQSATRSILIEQGYLALNERCSVRVRLWDDKGFITIKSKAVRGSFSRYEFEKEIPASEAEQLLALAMPGKIQKRRWIVPIDNNLTCEVDEFFGENKGLVLAEIELESEQQTFIMPSFISEEVTFDPRYFNSYLCQKPYSTW
ncbi:MAG: CYTH domain-containing protein [Paludibacteraceae bacterium]|nr:CYTH domain-containing protein [Paludibacteraceae bacterium]